MRSILLLLFLVIYIPLSGQFDHEAVYPEETGEILLELLTQEYKAETVLTFGEAKDILYGNIFVENDSVSCVYTGHTLYLKPGEDPSSYLYGSGSQNAINAEHNWPKSKGADEGNALSDLHNLFPSRLQVNSDRANLPFGEINDQQTDFWYYLDGKSSSIPSQNIELYSEGSNSLFEPREDHKGNVARSMFYFFTMYKDKVIAEDPDFFETMRPTLCEWHNMDPVDSLEWLRNNRIAAYQSGKKNPFILDCSLAGRSYCTHVSDECRALDSEPFLTQDLNVSIYPNPADSYIIIQSGSNKVKRIKLINMVGQQIYLLDYIEESGNREYYFNIPLNTLPGIYILELELEGESGKHAIRKKVVLS